MKKWTHSDVDQAGLFHQRLLAGALLNSPREVKIWILCRLDWKWGIVIEPFRVKDIVGLGFDSKVLLASVFAGWLTNTAKDLKSLWFKVWLTVAVVTIRAHFKSFTLSKLFQPVEFRCYNIELWLLSHECSSLNTYVSVPFTGPDLGLCTDSRLHIR